ncbi:MAG TPA: hypothetical protein PKB14_06195 [Rubrivivax sp.]|nr:hypothetical protein [Rubrivivax sp.]
MHAPRIEALQSVRRRAGSLAAASLLLLATAGCGGDGGDGPAEAEAAAFTVSVELPGFDKTQTRSGDEAAGLTVPFWKLDLSKVEFSSSSETTWSVEPASAVVDVIEDTPTRRIVSLAGMKTGEITFVFRNAARSAAGEARVRIAVEVEAQRYYAKRRQVGESFEWQRTDLWNGNESKKTEIWRVAEVRDEGSYTSDLDPPGSDYRVWYTRDGNWVQEDIFGMAGRYPNPSSKSYDFPLYAGKEWPVERLEYQWDEDTGYFQWRGMSTVEGREVVTVPAGSYDSLRIHTREANYGDDSESRDVRTYERTCWWSIELSAEVRCVELIRYNIDGKTLERRVTSELGKYSAP